MDSTLARIQRWYAAQCDGDWEHAHGLEIDTLDNPGWHIKIDLARTNLEAAEFKALTKDLDDPTSTDWHSIAVTSNTFEAFGDPSKLDFVLRTFLDWAERTDRHSA